MSSRVFIGGLPRDVRERDLEKFFDKYGRIREILLKNGYGFVDFEDYRDADDAVYELHGTKLLGERVVVEPAKGRPRGGFRDRYNDRSSGRRGGGGGYSSRSSRFGPPLRTKYRVIVENLSSGVSWQDLKDFMRKAGEVTFADAHKKRRNEGIVEFASLSEMKNAIEKLDDYELNGRRIRIIEDKTESRRRSRSMSRSRSASRSRSRSPRRSRSRSRSARRSRSRSPRTSKSRSISRSRSRSVSKPQSREKSPAKSKSRSQSVERSSRSNNRSPSRSKSRRRSSSISHKRSRSASRSLSRDRVNSKKSRSASKSRSHSRSPGGN